MNVLTDWNCQLLPGLCNYVKNFEEASRAILLLSEKFGFRRFHMMPVCNPDFEPIPIFRIRLDSALQRLSALLPKEILVGACGALYLSESLITDSADLSRLCLPKTNLLPVRLPPIPDHPNMARPLNHLLYHTDFQPLFLSFEKDSILYSDEEINRLLRLKNVAFSFGFSSLKDPKIRSMIQVLMQNQTPILLGSEANSTESAGFYELFSPEELADNQLSRSFWESVYYRSHITLRASFPNI